MMPVEIPAQRPLVYLQSLECAEICFVALPVYVIDPAFQLRLSEEERVLLQLPEDSDPVIGADVALPRASANVRLFGRGESECVGCDQSP